MRIAYHSLEMLSLSWIRRLMDEGHEVLVYSKESYARRVGRGLVNRCTSVSDWTKWGLQDPDTLFFFDFTESGELADRLRKAGKLVLGAGMLQDKIEKKRDIGEELAKQAGILCPPSLSFKTASQSIEFLSSNPKQQAGDGGWAWKPSKDLGKDSTLVSPTTEEIIRGIQHQIRRYGDTIPCVVQEKIPGVAISTSRWFNGHGWTGPYCGTIEEKKFMDGDIGPATGCSFNTVWFYREPEPKIAHALKFKELEAILREKNAGPGIYDINAVLNEQGAWFLEWTPRLGYDSEMTAHRAVTNLGEYLYNIATGKSIDHLVDIDNCYHGVNISVPPYPSVIKDIVEGDDGDSPALGTPVYGVDGMWEGNFTASGLEFDPEAGLTVANPLGYVGMVFAKNRSLTKGFDEIYKYLKDELKVQNLQYRTDAAKNIWDDIMKMHEAGWETTPVMRK